MKNILIKYWGHASFRPMQEEVINSVMEGQDTLALLPTGGGKSICFQVPAMAKEGACLVITPLIALMKDQVENLRRRGIKAAAIYSGMHRSEIDAAYNSVMFGNGKFLYISPERLATTTFIENLQRIKINLIAVDEAHCISQWGYDFRPPYLKIADIRKFLPKIPVLALTATATPDVVKDIQEKLNFPKENIFHQSFDRKNLTYVVFHEEDKNNRLLRVLSKTKGTGIIYVRNRRKTKEISDLLNKNKIKSDYYHAGLSNRIRDQKQDAWKKGRIQVIVATNAFGMGIDKPDVRLVIHLDLPDNLEAYFQEAGRAGRDEKAAWAVILFDDADIRSIKKNFELSYPEIKQIKAVYQALGNYFQLAIGSGKDASFDFDLVDFSEKFKIPPLIAFNVLKILEKEAYLLLSESLRSPSKLMIMMNRQDLYKFQVENSYYDPFLKLLLRSYSGIFTEFTTINENEIAKRLNIDRKTVINLLTRLNQMQVLTFIKQKEKPQIIFLVERIDVKNLYISKKNYENRKKSAAKKLQSVMNYVQSENTCRNQLLLSYFGDSDSKRCGRCDICQERNKIDINELEFDKIVKIIKPMLRKQPCFLQELIDHIAEFNEDKIIKVVRWLQDNGKVDSDDLSRLSWKKQTRLRL